MRVMRVQNVGTQPLDDARQLPGGGKIHLGARRERDELESLRHALHQFAAGMRHERRALTDGAQAVHRQQHLVLAAAPRSGRIDMKGEHLLPAGSCEDTTLATTHTGGVVFFVASSFTGVVR